MPLASFLQAASGRYYKPSLSERRRKRALTYPPAADIDAFHSAVDWQSIEKIDSHSALTPLQAASCTYRIALGPGQAEGREAANRLPPTRAAAPALCANAPGFSLHAAVRCAADQRRQLERLCRYITRPALANERLAIAPAMLCCN